MSDLHRKREVVFEFDSDCVYVKGTPFNTDHEANLTELIAWLIELREKAPLEHRTDLKLEAYASTDAEDCPIWGMRLFYDRDETEEERQKREQAAEISRASQIRYLEQQLKKLKGK